MFEHCWLIVLRGHILRGLGPRYTLQILSHRILRYASGLLHLVLLASTLALVVAGRGVVYDVALVAQLALVLGALAGVGIARYYVAHQLGDRGRARPLPASWRPRNLGRGGGHALNRALDVAGAAVVLALASPLLALSAIAVKLDGGPVLYRQTRVGKDGADFELLKLRTMVVGAEHIGAGFAVNRGDARITAAGRLLRRLSIDELPQLLNVLRGEMSLIGPRPTLRYQVERYDARQLRRLEVKPGLTGWAQIHGRAELPWADRIELDLWYVDHRSPSVDLRILLRTPLALFGGTYKGESGGWRPAG